MGRYNSTIIQKKKPCLNCGKPSYIFSKGRCQPCAKIEDSKKRIAEFEETEMDESLQNLISDLDFIFSRFIRLKYADEHGFVKCFTSGKKMRWQEIQCGHFIPRANLSTRWMEDNCRPQSEHDNCILTGNLKVFRQNLELEKPGITEWLEEQGRQIFKPTREELKALIVEYRFKIKLLGKGGASQKKSSN